MYGYPWPPMMPYPMGGMGTDDKTVQLAKQIIKQHKADKKRKLEEDKKKEAKTKPKLFTILELTGAVFFFSIPVVLCQMMFITYVQHWMTQLTNAPH